MGISGKISKKGTSENPIRNEVEVAVLGYIEICTVNIRRVSESIDGSRTCIQRILEKHNYHPYEINQHKFFRTVPTKTDYNENQLSFLSDEILLVIPCHLIFQG